MAEIKMTSGGIGGGSAIRMPRRAAKQRSIKNQHPK